MGDSSERAEPLLISCSVKAERKRCRTTNRAETCSHVRYRRIADNADFAELIAMTPREAFNLAVSLVGQPISYVWQGYGSALFIGFGSLRPVAKRDGPSGNPEGDVSLEVEWSWRIEP